MKKTFSSLATLLLLVVGIVTFQACDSGGISVKNQPITKSTLEAKTPIIDIRTKAEWKETGVIPESHLITFYDKDGKYDQDKFISEVEKIVKKDDVFMIVCRSGNRSGKISRILVSKGYANVINSSGGIKEAIKNSIPFIPYEK